MQQQSNSNYIIATDASLNILSNQPNYGWAYIVYNKNGSRVHQNFGRTSFSTINKSEIYAIKKALDFIIEFKIKDATFEFIIDNNGSYNILNGFATPKNNINLWLTIKNSINYIESKNKLIFTKVKSHSENKFNDEVDALAKQSARAFSLSSLKHFWNNNKEEKING